MYQYYNPYYQGNYQQISNPQANQQNQSTGLVSIPSENDARNYPVAYGNSVIFKDENAPYVYTKTMGFSQLERPIFEKYRLVKEEEPETKEDPLKDFSTSDKMESELSNLKAKITEQNSEIEKLWEEINTMKKPTKKKESE